MASLSVLFMQLCIVSYEFKSYSTINECDFGLVREIYWDAMKLLLADCATETAEAGIQRIREQTSAARNVRHVPCRCSYCTSSAVTSWKTLL